MKRMIFFSFILTLINISIAFCQQAYIDPSVKLPLNEKVALYFIRFKDGKITQGASRFAGHIVFEFGVNVIPYMKEYIKNTEYFHYKQEPKDVTLGLIAYILLSLHTYNDPIYKDVVQEYYLDKNDIIWFVNQYKCKLDQYIYENKVIDEIVLIGETHMTYITGYHKNWNNGKWIGGNEIETYGHPDFFNKGGSIKIPDIKKYYEERLGIVIQIMASTLEERRW